MCFHLEYPECRSLSWMHHAQVPVVKYNTYMRFAINCYDFIAVGAQVWMRQLMAGIGELQHYNLWDLELSHMCDTYAWYEESCTLSLVQCQAVRKGTPQSTIPYSAYHAQYSLCQIFGSSIGRRTKSIESLFFMPLWHIPHLSPNLQLHDLQRNNALHLQQDTIAPKCRTKREHRKQLNLTLFRRLFY